MVAKQAVENWITELRFPSSHEYQDHPWTSFLEGRNARSPEEFLNKNVLPLCPQISVSLSLYLHLSVSVSLPASSPFCSPLGNKTISSQLALKAYNSQHTSLHLLIKGIFWKITINRNQMFVAVMYKKSSCHHLVTKAVFPIWRQHWGLAKHSGFVIQRTRLGDCGHENPANCLN